jgi:hypothetical protein
MTVLDRLTLGRVMVTPLSRPKEMYATMQGLSMSAESVGLEDEGLLLAPPQSRHDAE